MSKCKNGQKMRPAHTLHFNQKKYPDVLDAANNLAKKLDRKPHDAIRTFLKAVDGNIDDVVKLCREKGAAI